jgi:imidazolonepropionase
LRQILNPVSAERVRLAFDLAITGVRLCPMTDGPAATIDSGALALSAGRIAWLGTMHEFEALRANCPRLPLDGRCVTPGFIDCHTHLVHAGRRTDEFVQRLEGVSYAEISRRGGGIASTVQATRAAGFELLASVGERRVRRALAGGTTRFEIKSGYGLNLESEREMLRAARAIGTRTGASVHTTFLGLHAVPREFANRAEDYVTYAVDDMLPTLAREGLVDSVDAFCEHVGFSPAQVRRLFERAKALGLPVRLHADQLSDSHGAALAASFGALSADHLEYTNSDGVAALAAAGTVAVLLPGAFHFLRETQRPPVAELRAAGVPMAVATDWNPGSSPVASLSVAMNLACIYFGLTPSEALAGVTRNAARALGCLDECGTLEVGKRADLAIWNVEDIAQIVESLDDDLLHSAWIGGRCVVSAPRLKELVTAGDGSGRAF